MSEYAARLVDAIDELWGHVNDHDILSDPMSQEDINLAINLDGRIEALRIRLGIPQIVPKERTPTKGTELIGFTRLGIHTSGSFRDPTNPRRVHSDCDGDWYYRMRSLKAIAQELAVTPELDPEEQEIVALLLSVGHRLTTTQILDEFSQRGAVKAESTVKGKLAQLTRRKVLVNRSDTSPKGYGLPEWV